jgi:glutaminyl-tRNA synthetase
MRIMGVLNPLKVTIENYPEGQVEELDAINNPEDETAGTRRVPFSKNIYIEKEDFMENPPKKYFRLSPGSEVRLRYAYFITCKEVIKNSDGEITGLICTYDPASRGGNSPDGRKVKSTLHWVSVDHAVEAEVRLYDRLFSNENPYRHDIGESFLSNLNPNSLTIVKGYIEPSVKTAQPLDNFQFERLGYFCMDKSTTVDKPVFNLTVTLKDTWAKIAGKEE